MANAEPSRPTFSAPVAARLGGAGVFLASLYVYFKTMFPDLPFGDSGELAGALYTLGICHSSGYPTFTLVGFLFSHLPIPGEPIFRLNLLVALWVAGSAFAFYKICLLVLRHLRPAGKGGESLAGWHILLSIGGALSYAFARTVWDQAGGIEVYSLQLLLANTLIFFALKGALVPEDSRRSFLWASVFLGLSFTNHLTTAFLVPGLLVLFFHKEGFSRRSFGLFGSMFLLALVPLALYLYLPLRSSSTFPFSGLPTPVFNGGMVGSGWNYFFAHVFGSGFHGLMFRGGMQKQVGAFAALLPTQLAYVGFVPLCLGIHWLFRRRSVVLWFLAAVCLFSLVFVLNYQIEDIDAYFLPVFTAFLLLMVIGLAAIQPRARWISYGCFVLPAIALATNYAAEDNSGDLMVPEFIRTWADNTEPNGVIFTSNWGYFRSGLLYLQTVKGYRRDVAIIIPSNFPTFPFYPVELMNQLPDVTAGSESALRALRDELRTSPTAKQETINRAIDSLVDCNLPRRPVYFGYDSVQVVMGRKQLIPVGLAGRVYDPSKPAPVIPSRFDLTKILAVDFERGDTKHKLSAARMIKAALENAIGYETGTGQLEEARRHSDMLQALVKKLPPAPSVE